MSSFYDNNKDFNDYLIGNLYIEAKNKEEAGNAKCVKIPDSITSMGDSTFNCCFSLISVIIPNSITSISDSAFYNCPNLKSILIPDSVTFIGDDAFAECSNLKSITIPKRFETRLAKIFYKVDLSKVSITYI